MFGVSGSPGLDSSLKFHGTSVGTRRLYNGEVFIRHLFLDDVWLLRLGWIQPKEERVYYALYDGCWVRILPFAARW